ncbi:BRCA1-associated protein [Arachis hypogaea]|nr:BRCA1-associated protein [Arachis hypogaea]
MKEKWRSRSRSRRESIAISSPPIPIPIPIPIPNEEPLSFSTSIFNFSSENPRIEETRGLMHLFPDQVPPSTLPFGRKPLVCVVSVPNHMTYADFCQFCGSFLHYILEMRIVRMDGTEDQYSVLIRFDNQGSTDSFFKHYNSRRFSSLVEYIGSIEHAQPSNATSVEQPTCPVCLELLDQDTSGILTTLCNHSFHCSCISKWADSSCPVCRYCQQQAEKSICSVCRTTENLWICVICGFVGCGRYKAGHAIMHWKETQHYYALDVETKRVWDFAGDTYLVELNTHCVHAENGCGSCSCEDNSMSEALLNSKVEAIVNEYNELLATQLENQKSYFEMLLQEVKEETKIKIFKAVQKAIDRRNKEKKFLEELNENLVKNEDAWKAKLLEIEERYLMTCLDDAKPEQQQLPEHNEIKDGLVSASSKECSSTTNSQLGKNP